MQAKPAPFEEPNLKGWRTRPAISRRKDPWAEAQPEAIAFRSGNEKLQECRDGKGKADRDAPQIPYPADSRNVAQPCLLATVMHYQPREVHHDPQKTFPA